MRLRCPKPEAAALLASMLEEVLAHLERDHVTLIVCKDRGEGRQHLELSRTHQKSSI